MCVCVFEREREREREFVCVLGGAKAPLGPIRAASVRRGQKEGGMVSARDSPVIAFPHVPVLDQALQSPHRTAAASGFPDGEAPGPDCAAGTPPVASSGPEGALTESSALVTRVASMARSRSICTRAPPPGHQLLDIRGLGV